MMLKVEADKCHVASSADVLQHPRTLRMIEREKTSHFSWYVLSLGFNEECRNLLKYCVIHDPVRLSENDN